MSGERYLLRLRTIPSVVTFLTTVIALHTCYFCLSIAFGLLFLSHSSIWPTFLRGARTSLELPTSCVLVAFRPDALGDKSHIGSPEHFQALLLHFEVALYLTKGFQMVRMSQDCPDLFPLWRFVRESPNHIQDLLPLRNVFSCGLEITNYATHNS